MTSARNVALNNEGKEHNVLGVLLVFCHEGKSYGLRTTYREQPLCPCLYVPARSHTGIVTIAPPVTHRPYEIILLSKYVAGCCICGTELAPILCNANGARREIIRQCEYLRNVQVLKGSAGMFACAE